MNKVIIMGRLTRDPDVRYAKQGEDMICIARYTLAVDRRTKSAADGKKEADFISCVAFRKNGEFAEKYLHQGTKISVVGSLQTGSYTNRDNKKVYTTDVIVDEQEFCESKTAGQQPNKPAEEVATQPSDVGQGFMNIPDGVEDDGLPFN